MKTINIIGMILLIAVLIYVIKTPGDQIWIGLIGGMIAGVLIAD